MNWTTEKPKQEGYYWYAGPAFKEQLDSEDPVVVRIENIFALPFQEHEFEVEVPGVEGSFNINDIEGLWYGPIEVPRRDKLDVKAAAQ